LLQCLVKPAVKESTKPIDPKLHTDIRAIDRAEFDQQVVPLSSITSSLSILLSKASYMIVENTTNMYHLMGF